MIAFNSNSYPSCEPLVGELGFAMESPAKINLGLRILARREDGYHDIETVFQEISLTDRIEFRLADSWRLTCSDERLDCGDNNLITRAASRLAEATGHPLTGALHLIKRIPVGGGLGGGSSNAAIALLGLERLWKLNTNIELLRRTATQTSADCPFFLRGGLACGTGRGDRLEWISGAISGEIVLVFGGFSVSTKWAYENVKLSLTKGKKNSIIKSLLLQPDPLHALRRGTANDLEPAVFARWPELEHLKASLYDAGADLAALSGSGATVFGIFRSRPIAEEATMRFEDRYRTLICSPVARTRPNSPSCP